MLFLQTSIASKQQQRVLYCLLYDEAWHDAPRGAQTSGGKRPALFLVPLYTGVKRFLTRLFRIWHYLHIASWMGRRLQLVVRRKFVTLFRYYMPAVQHLLIVAPSRNIGQLDIYFTSRKLDINCIADWSRISSAELELSISAEHKQWDRLAFSNSSYSTRFSTPRSQKTS